MSKYKSYFFYLAFTVLAGVGIGLPVVAHSESDGWGHHMAGGTWGWGPMVLFWTTGVLLITLLIVTLLKTIRDN